MASGNPPSERDPADDVVVVPAEALPLPFRQRLVDFLRRVVDKAGEDSIFFMAGAISFNVLLAIVPLFLFAVGVGGLVLNDRFPDPAGVLTELLLDNIPAIGGDINLIATVRAQIEALLEQSAGLAAGAAILLIWFSSRIVGTLRIALKEVFDVALDRGIVGGKIFDVKMVVLGGALFTLNIGVTGVVSAVQGYGVDVLGLEGRALTTVQQTVAFLVAFLSIWVLFLVIYRFLPARRVPWRAALIAATFAALFHEVLKNGFGWYVTNVATFETTYGNLVSLAALFLWIYWEAVVFILGGEVAQVWAKRRARRLKTRSALFEAGRG